MEGVNPSLSVLMKGASGRELEVLFDMSALGLAVQSLQVTWKMVSAGTLNLPLFSTGHVIKLSKLQTVCKVRELITSKRCCEEEITHLCSWYRNCHKACFQQLPGIVYSFIFAADTIATTTVIAIVSDVRQLTEPLSAFPFIC